MELSDKGVKLITNFEGLYLKAYDDRGKNGGGIWTIGYGTISYPDGTPVQEGDTCTKEQAIEWFKYEVKEKEEGVVDLIDVDLNQDQFDTLVSFAYNLGLGCLKKSTLRKLLNDGDYDAVPEQILKFDHDGGKVVKGLTRRRRAEAHLWKTGELKFDFDDESEV